MHGKDCCGYLRVLIAAAVITGSGCGDNGASSPSTSAGMPTIAEVQIHSIGGFLKVGQERFATSTVRFSDGSSTGVRPEWGSSNSMVMTVDENGRMTGVSPGVAGLRATYVGVTQEIPVRVVRVTSAPAPGVSPSSAPVVVSEFRSRGGAGENDEFIEVWNVSDQSLDLAGWSIAVADAQGATMSTGAVPAGTRLAPECFYLFTGSGVNAYSSGSTAIGDFLYDAALDDDGSFALVDAQGGIVDQVGLSSGARYFEGSPLSDIHSGSYERTGPDTNDNLADFRQPTTGNPASTQSPCRF